MKFVDSRKGTTKDGRAYSIVELSDGLQSKVFGAPENFDHNQGLKPGADVEVTLTCNPMDDRRPFTVDTITVTK